MGSRAARAGGSPALWLAAALFAAALPRGLPAAAACPGPRSRAAASGHTRSVTCTGVGAARIEGPARLLFGLPVDLNRADRLTLETLPGLGPTRAAAVLAARPFRSLEQLRQVPGVGPRTFARLSPVLSLEVRPGDTGARPHSGDLLPANRR